VARIGGRNSALAWVVGLGCVAVVGGLLVLAIPAVPTGIQMMGDTLRAGTSAPEAAGPGALTAPVTTTPECRALYTEALWSELTQRAGGDPVQDATPPVSSAPSLVSALAPEVRVTCAFTGTNTGHIVTTVSGVSKGAAAVARATLETNGFACTDFGGSGVRCERTTADGIEEHAVRDGVWVSTLFTGWRPDRYLDRIALQLWPE
jgi:hypothetical protein